MKICRFSHQDKISYGSFQKDKVILLDGTPYSNLSLTNISYKTSGVEILPPVEPTKIIAVGLNFKGIGGTEEKQDEPMVFFKAPSSLTTNGATVTLPFPGKVWGESEVAAVISKKTTNITEDQVIDHILGYIPVNDVTCENIHGRDHHLPRSKSANGFCPVGNYIDTEYSLENKMIRAFHNETLLREGNTDQMIFNNKWLISWLSKWLTLEAGDMVMFGAPSRVRDRLFLVGNDSFRVEVEGFDPLISRFKSE